MHGHHHRVTDMMSSGVPSANRHRNITVKTAFLIFPKCSFRNSDGGGGVPPAPCSSSNCVFYFYFLFCSGRAIAYMLCLHSIILRGPPQIKQITSTNINLSESGSSMLPVPASACRRPYACGADGDPPPVKLKSCPAFGGRPEKAARLVIDKSIRAIYR